MWLDSFVLKTYGVLIHSRNLILTDEDGQECVGGAYGWRFVRARNETDACTQAMNAFLKAPVFVEQVRNLHDASANATVEEVRQMKPTDREGSGVVFYLGQEDGEISDDGDSAS